MRLVIHLVRKDAARLRWIWLASLLPLALMTWFECGFGQFLPGNLNWEFGQFTQILLPLAWWFFAAALVQSEPLPGDRQYWLTRPIPRGALLASKLAGAGLMILCPLFVSYAAILASNGHSVIANLPSILLDFARILVIILLPAMAVAAVTDDLARFIVASFAALIGLVMLASATGLIAPWGGETVNLAARSVSLWACAAAAAAVLAIQYKLRATRWSRVIAAAAVMLLPFWRLMPLHAALAIQTPGVDREPARRLRIALDPSRGPLTVRGGQFGYDGTVRLSIPVKIEGAGAEPEIRFEWTGHQIAGASGAHASKVPYGVSVQMALDGARLSLNPKREFLDRVRNEPVSIRLHGAATLMSSPVRTRTPAAFPYRAVPGVGFCHADASPDQFALRLFCNAPFRSPEWITLRIVDRATGEPLTAKSRMYPHQSHSVMGGLWAVSPLARLQQAFPYTMAEGIPRDRVSTSDMDFVAWTPVSSAMVDFRLDGVRLGDWVVQPAGN